MTDKVKKQEDQLSKTGAVPRTELENLRKPPAQQAPPPPSTLPEFPEDGASTGSVYIVSEDADYSAQGDDDSPTGY